MNKRRLIGLILFIAGFGYFVTLVIQGSEDVLLEVSCFIWGIFPGLLLIAISFLNFDEEVNNETKD